MLILQVMKDKERLRRRTQLKRSVYRVLGRPDDEVETAKGTDQSDPERDAHLKDYDENIFDDDDFYHQVSWGRHWQSGIQNTTSKDNLHFVVICHT